MLLEVAVSSLALPLFVKLAERIDYYCPFAAALFIGSQLFVCIAFQPVGDVVDFVMFGRPVFEVRIGIFAYLTFDVVVIAKFASTTSSSALRISLWRAKLQGFRCST